MILGWVLGISSGLVKDKMCEAASWLGVFYSLACAVYEANEKA